MLYDFNLINMHPYFTLSYGSFIKDIDQFAEELIEIKNKYSEQSDLTPFLVLMDVMEGRVYGEELVAVIDRLRILLKQHNMLGAFILDGDFVHLSKVPQKEDITYSNFFALSTYYHIIKSKTQKANKKWNSDSQLGLFIPGKLARPHRIHLIAKLWNKKLLGSIKYSCQILSSEEQQIKDEFLKYDDGTFERFKKECTSVLDLDYSGKPRFESHGYPYNVKLYKDTSFSIITESDFAWGHAATEPGKDGTINWLPKLTEKTYRAITNKHPFIVCWYPGMIKKIKKLGFRSFTEYLPHPNYNDIPNLHERINYTVENIKSFPQVKDKYRTEIERDVEYNYQLVLDMCDKEFKKIQHILNLPQSANPVHFKNVGHLVHFMFPIPNF